MTSTLVVVSGPSGHRYFRGPGINPIGETFAALRSRLNTLDAVVGHLNQRGARDVTTSIDLSWVLASSDHVVVVREVCDALEWAAFVRDEGIDR